MLLTQTNFIANGLHASAEAPIVSKMIMNQDPHLTLMEQVFLILPVLFQVILWTIMSALIIQMKEDEKIEDTESTEDTPDIDFNDLNHLSYLNNSYLLINMIFYNIIKNIQ